MKIQFKKLAFVSLVVSGMLLGSVNASETQPKGDKNKSGETADSGKPKPLVVTTLASEKKAENSQLTKDTATITGLNNVSVTTMGTTLSVVTQLSLQTAKINNLLSNNSDLSNTISNSQNLSDAFNALANAQNILKDYLNSSSATIGQLTSGSSVVLDALNNTIHQVNVVLNALNSVNNAAESTVPKVQTVALSDYHHKYQRKTLKLF